MCLKSRRLCLSPLPAPAAPAEIAATATTSPTAATNAARAVLERAFLIVSSLPRSESDEAGVFQLRPGAHRVVHAPFGTKGLADLAHRAVRAQRLAHRRQEVGLPPRGVPHRLERLGRLGRVP